MIDIQNVFRGEAVPSKVKNSIGKKFSYSGTSYGLEHEKTASVNYLRKCL